MGQKILAAETSLERDRSLSMVLFSRLANLRINAVGKTHCRSLRFFHHDANAVLSRFTPLQQLAPCFSVEGSNITPMNEPSEFYSSLKVRNYYSV
jgi:hypothetical protein